MSDRLTVKANTTLIPFLIAQLQGWSRSTIKQRLESRLDLSQSIQLA